QDVPERPGQRPDQEQEGPVAAARRREVLAAENADDGDDHARDGRHPERVLPGRGPDAEALRDDEVRGERDELQGRESVPRDPARRPRTGSERDERGSRDGDRRPSDRPRGAPLAEHRSGDEQDESRLQGSDHGDARDARPFERAEEEDLMGAEKSASDERRAKPVAVEATLPAGLERRDRPEERDREPEPV